MMPWDRGDRTYWVSDERLAAFGRLTVEQRLRWVEELAAFVRLARLGAPPPMVAEEPTAPAPSPRS
jgi:hypothetical protein